MIPANGSIEDSSLSRKARNDQEESRLNTWGHLRMAEADHKGQSIDCCYNRSKQENADESQGAYILQGKRMADVVAGTDRLLDSSGLLKI